MNFQPKGIIPALIMPLTPEGKIYEKALRKLLNFVIDNGVRTVKRKENCLLLQLMK